MRAPRTCRDGRPRPRHRGRSPATRRLGDAARRDAPCSSAQVREWSEPLHSAATRAAQLRFQIRRAPEAEAFPANFVRVERVGGDIVSTFVARGSKTFAVDVHCSVPTARSIVPLADQLAVQSPQLKAAIARENSEVVWEGSLESAIFPWLPVRAAVTMANELLEHGIVTVNFACPSPLGLPAPDPATNTIVILSGLEVAVSLEVFAAWISALAKAAAPAPET